VLGSFGNVAGQYKQNKFEDKLAPKISELIEKNFDGFAVDNDIFHRDEEGNIVYENNKIFQAVRKQDRRDYRQRVCYVG
jgi:hypothetical protein